MNVQITDLDLERFTEGDCLILAQEIHYLTGWGIYAFHYGGNERVADCHAFVRAPDGRFVDVEGVSQPRTYVRRWNRNHGIEGYRTAPEFMYEGGWNNWDRDKETYVGSRARARRIAPLLIAQAGGA